MADKREDLLQRIIAWAQGRGDVRGLALIGSGARDEQPADEWSDLDFVLVSAEAGRYLGGTEWFAEIAEPWIATVERSPQGVLYERRVLFYGGLDADFILLSSADLGPLGQEPLATILTRGIKVLVDKDQLLSGSLPGIRASQGDKNRNFAPTAEEFSELVNDFWYHAVWTAKKIRRGELWTAKSCCDVYMKSHLLKAVEWTAGEGVQTWYNGRFIERWAGADVLARLRGVFAHYEEEDLWRALGETMALFDRCAQATALRLGYPYPRDAAKGITSWVNARLLS